MKAFEYIDVKSVDAAVAALPSDATMDDYNRSVMLKAGGIDLLDQMKERMIEPDKLVNLKGSESELRYIREDNDSLLIGPLTTLAELGSSPLVRGSYQALADAAGEAATPQIRNMATVGGNLCQRPRCWYFRNHEFHCLKKGGEVCFAQNGENQYHAVFGTGPSHIVHPSSIGPALVAAQATIVTQSGEGSREIEANDFFVMPNVNVMVENVLAADEVITEIKIPKSIKQSAHYEVREKQSYDWPLVSASVALTDDGWKVALGAVAPIPWRATAVEELLGSKTMTSALAAEAAELATEGARPMRYNEYKLNLIKVAVRRTLMRAAGLEVSA